MADDWGLMENYDENGDGYGLCPDCGASLHNWGAVSHGDGDLVDEIGCDICEEVVYEIHSDYCQCVDCSARKTSYRHTLSEEES